MRESFWWGNARKRILSLFGGMFERGRFSMREFSVGTFSRHLRFNKLVE